MTGIRGRLVTESFARDVVPTLRGFSAPPRDAARALEAWAERNLAALGPSSGPRAVADVAVIPLLAILGFTVAGRDDAGAFTWLRVTSNGRPGPAVLVAGWNESLSHVWRAGVLGTIARDGRWCLCCNGACLRIVDAHRTWLRDYLEFDLHVAAADPHGSSLLWTLAGRDSADGPFRMLDGWVELSARHGTALCRSLGSGVLDALGLLLTAAASPRSRSRRAAPRRRDSPPGMAPGAQAAPDLQTLFDELLTVVYRLLFLLFAEARGLVPVWHPVYRDRYSLEVIVTALAAGRPCRRLWEALQAISRLAHAGCTAGDLKVAAFNGRLFAPSQTAALRRAFIDDDTAGRAVIAVSTARTRKNGGLGRIVYRDLDVEQLGAVYEHVLDYAPAAGGLERTRDVRKASGTFYTPRSVTTFLVQRALAPLVDNRSADEILALRIVDPAMGSGAFLVAACGYLAARAEDALIRDGRWHPGDVTASDRVALKREIASRCLFGVDANPTAVQLARLSMWLATLAADKPLSFLDHRLVAGDSLVGATPADVAREPGRRRGFGRRQRTMPLFDGADLDAQRERAAAVRLELASRPDDSAAVVRDKEARLSALMSPGSPLARWSRVLDLWCAGWFWDDVVPLGRGTFGELASRLLNEASALPDHVSAALLARARAIADRHRFLHWPLAFPEVFTSDRAGDAAGGFDAVLGNPPWDMVRGDSGQAGVRSERRLAARQLTAFARESGVYRASSRAHLNRYQLFLERALQLVRPGGRIGFVLPSGIAGDTGAAGIRRLLFARADVDTVTGLDNRAAIFPVHRGLRFALLTCTAGRPTTAIACRFGLTRAEELAPTGGSGSAPIVLTRRFLARLSGEDDLGLPEVSSPVDLQIIERVSADHPWLAHADGWQARFGRELNATDDRRLFSPRTGAAGARPVVEGKQIEPFRTALDTCRLELGAAAAGRARILRRARLAYRDVASATNRLTLIAAIVPASAVTTHTLTCLKTPLPLDEQHVLCGLLNSFVANYLIRLRVNTHVTSALVSRLPVPVVGRDRPEFRELRDLSRALAAAVTPIDAMPEYASLQARVARLYRLTQREFAHVLGTFPLVAEDVRRAALDRFEGLR